MQLDRLNRRQLLPLLGGALAAWPGAVRGQQSGQLRRLAVLNALADDAEGRFRIATFQQRLGELGWIEGRNIRTEIRWGNGDAERIRVLGAELAATRPDVILAITTPAVQALRQATATLPIVFTNVGDPDRSGIVESLARPGGNVTGITTFVQSMGGKWLELLKEIVPAARDVLVLLNPDNPTSQGVLQVIETAAATIGVRITPAGVRDAEQIDRAIESFATSAERGLIVLPDPVTVANRERIVASAKRHRVPAVYPFRFFAAAGGLLSYGTVATEQYRQAASYVDRVLKGTKPAELPVQLPTRFELIVNLGTAKAMGLAISETFLVRADEVIE